MFEYINRGMNKMPNPITPAEKKIRIAGIAGVVLSVFTILQMLLPVTGFSPATLVGFILHSQAEGSGRPPPEILGTSGLYLILNLSVFILVAAMTAGTFLKSRWCAVVLFSYCIIVLITSIPMTVWLFEIPTIILGVLAIFIFLGLEAAFKYRKEQTGKEAAGKTGI